LKAKIQEFINSLILYDYILFGSILILFVLLIVLAILLRHRLGLAVTMVLLAFVLFVAGPPLGYIELHKYLFKNEVTLIAKKELHFTPAVIVEGSLKNLSKFDFKECKITADFYRVTKNKYKNYIYKLKPFKKKTIIEKDIVRGETRNFKMIIEPFSYKKEYNISLGASCL